MPPPSAINKTPIPKRAGIPIKSKPRSTVTDLIELQKSDIGVATLEENNRHIEQMACIKEHTQRNAAKEARKDRKEKAKQDLDTLNAQIRLEELKQANRATEQYMMAPGSHSASPGSSMGTFPDILGFDNGSLGGYHLGK